MSLTLINTWGPYNAPRYSHGVHDVNKCVIPGIDSFTRWTLGFKKTLTGNYVNVYITR